MRASSEETCSSQRVSEREGSACPLVCVPVSLFAPTAGTVSFSGRVASAAHPVKLDELSQQGLPVMGTKLLAWLCATYDSNAVCDQVPPITTQRVRHTHYARRRALDRTRCASRRVRLCVCLCVEAASP